MDSDEIITLLKRRKKGVLRLIFSRIGLILLLMLVQVFVLASVYRWFSGAFSFFKVGQTIFTAAMVLFLFNCNMDATAKLTWLFLIMLFPVPASIFLWYTRKDVGHRLSKKRILSMIGESSECLCQNSTVLNKYELQQSGTDDLVRYLNRSGSFPIYENTAVIYFPIGEAMFETLLEQLKKAEKFIFMEYFIIDEGEMWGRILKLLADKAAEGVDVRVMYDGMCEVKLLPHSYPRQLEKLGIHCKPFTPLDAFISTQYNYRDHRKITVIDGKTAFSGGINLADEYINRKSRFGHWKDTAVMLKGEAVESFTLMFLQMWNITEERPSWEEAKIKAPRCEARGYVIPYGDCPLDGERVGEMVYMDILGRAKSYVHIMTPYLILDNELETALKFAAERGVEVKIILPGIPDKKSAYALAKTHYNSLLESGVRLYSYTPGFVHAKVFVSDDEKAVVGTINLDYRSLYHHFECAAYLYKTDCISDIEADFEKTLEKCREINAKDKEKLGYRILGVILKTIAPLM